MSLSSGCSCDTQLSSEHVGEIRFALETQQGPELLRPPELVFRIERIARQHAHVPQAIVEHGRAQLEPGQRDIQVALAVELLGNVRQRTGHPKRRAIGGPAGRSQSMEPAVFAAAYLDAITHVVGGIAATIIDVGHQLSQLGRPVLRMQTFGQAFQPVRKFGLGLETQQPTELRRPPDLVVRIERVACDHVHVPQTISGTRGDQLEAHLDAVALRTHRRQCLLGFSFRRFNDLQTLRIPAQHPRLGVSHRPLALAATQYRLERGFQSRTALFRIEQHLAPHPLASRNPVFRNIGRRE